MHNFFDFCNFFDFLTNFLFVLDIPTQVPPLTPGTNKKMTEALKASFASWEKEQIKLNITKGKVYLLISVFLLTRIIPMFKSKIITLYNHLLIQVCFSSCSYSYYFVYTSQN